jgi:lysophospholipase L1-like esterase
MKTVLCFGDSNTWGAAPMADLDDRRRFGPEQRWPGIARARLGAGWHVIEEGLPGRTIAHDDPVEGADRNALRYLLPCLNSHAPLDAVVLTLGTNNLKARFGLSADQIATSLHALVEIIAANSRLDGRPPVLLLVCPAPIVEVGCLGSMFAGGAAKSALLAERYRAIARQHGALFLDAGTVIESSPIDGIHLDEAAHATLGQSIAEILGGIG